MGGVRRPIGLGRTLCTSESKACGVRGIVDVIAAEAGGGQVSESVTGRWSCFVGHASPLFICVVYSPPPALCPPGMKEIAQDATVPGAGSRYVDGRPSQRNYVTAFQVADRATCRRLAAMCY